MVKGDRIYPHRPDLAKLNYYMCECGAYVGCHKGTTNPLGNPAGALTRVARSRAHGIFDCIWQWQLMTRKEAYIWLSGKMGLPDVHIGELTQDQAFQVVQIATAYHEERKKACSLIELSDL